MKNHENFCAAFMAAVLIGLVGCKSASGSMPEAVPNGAERETRPNILLILSDDQGYADLSCLGTPGVSTPNLDQLAADGIRMTDWYANSPICAPSRVALLTGLYPINAGMNVNIMTRKHNTGLPLEVPTIADALKELGYHTSIFGKWHLGARPDYWPTERGFDHWFGMKGGAVDFYSHILYYEEAPGIPPIHDLYENGVEVWENGTYFTDLITDRAVTYFNNLADSGDNKPFFSFLAYTDPHYPMHAPEELVEQFKHLSPARRMMAAKIKALDDSIGVIFEALKKNGQFDNTLILFMSDNGPSREVRNWFDETATLYPGGKTGGFKGHKKSLFEGGIRVPGIVSWPGRIPKGKVSSEIGMAMDVFPTFLAAASGDLERYDLDGKNLLPMFMHGEPSPHRGEPVFWEFRGQYGVRKGNFKLVVNGVDFEETSPADQIHLANLSEPQLDRVNLKAENPEITEELKALADAWYKAATTHYEEYWAPKNVDQRSDPPYLSNKAD